MGSVQTRELLEMPSSSGPSMRYKKSSCSERVWESCFFFLCSFPFLSPPLPFLAYPLFSPSFSSPFLPSSVLQPPATLWWSQHHISLQEPKLWEGGSSSAFSGAAILRGGGQPPLPFFSLSSVWPICLQNHGSAWQSEILAQRLKSGPRESKSTREITKRKKLGKATP